MCKPFTLECQIPFPQEANHKVLITSAELSKFSLKKMRHPYKPAFTEMQGFIPAARFDLKSRATCERFLWPADGRKCPPAVLFQAYIVRAGLGTPRVGGCDPPVSRMRGYAVPPWPETHLPRDRHILIYMSLV
jgi:hypothetical protein